MEIERLTVFISFAPGRMGGGEVSEHIECAVASPLPPIREPGLGGQVSAGIMRGGAESVTPRVSMRCRRVSVCPSAYGPPKREVLPVEATPLARSLLVESLGRVEQCLVDLCRIAILDHVIDDLAHP